jgi:N-acetylmuramoyl-L-alanine amidase CwlA
VEFQKKFIITKKHLTPRTKRRPGVLLSPAVKFIVAHDTGNPGSTAKNNVDYYEKTNNQTYASAHIFVDDKAIIECIPSITVDKPEKAWHVRYAVAKDKELYNCKANDAAVGVEYCFGGNIDARKSYDRYMWVIAYLCFKYKLNPRASVVGHFVLDPGRKSDPVSGLKFINKTYEQLLKDIANEYKKCLISQ